MKKVSTLIITTVIGFLIGLLYFQATEIGFFVTWKSLGIPPEFPTELSAFTYTEIYVKTENNKYYACNILSLVNCWQESKLPIEEVHVEKNSCQDSEINHLYFNKPKSKTISCKHAMLFVPGAFSNNYYLITEGGEIWVWHFFSPSWYQSYLINLPMFTLVGMVCGLVIGLLILKLKHKKVKV